MTIRRATSTDIETIRHIAKESWETDYPNLLSRETIEEGFEEWYAPERIKSELEKDDAILLIGVENNKAVGFAHGIRAQRTGHILRVYVTPDYRDQGVGSNLLTSTRDALLTRGVDQIQAMVLAENDPGNAFYRAFGFEKIDEQETIVGGKTYSENVYERRR
jgi:ribosomal protein S18 acetylase RimI-like enzyme